MFLFVCFSVVVVLFSGVFLCVCFWDFCCCCLFVCFGGVSSFFFAFLFLLFSCLFVCLFLVLLKGERRGPSNQCTKINDRVSRVGCVPF